MRCDAKFDFHEFVYERFSKVLYGGLKKWKFVFKREGESLRLNFHFSFSFCFAIDYTCSDENGNCIFSIESGLSLTFECSRFCSQIFVQSVMIREKFIM